MYAAVIVKIMDDLLKVRELRECPAEIHLEIQAVKKPIMWKLPDLREIKEKMFVWFVFFFFSKESRFVFLSTYVPYAGKEVNFSSNKDTQSRKSRNWAQSRKLTLGPFSSPVYQLAVSN